MTMLLLPYQQLTQPGMLPNVRMVLLREIEDASFVFYTNYGDVVKEIFDSQLAAFLYGTQSHWRASESERQVEKEDGKMADILLSE